MFFIPISVPPKGKSYCISHYNNNSYSLYSYILVIVKVNLT